MIKVDIILNYFDGPTEFIGKYLEPGMQFARTCYGFWVYEDEDNVDRLFSIWAVDSQGFKMENIRNLRESEIDWSEAEY